MAKQTKLTRSQLEEIITEELGELDEGMLDRMMAKLSSTGAGAKASVGNIAKKVLNVGLKAFDAPELQMLDPKAVKQMTALASRMTKAGKQIEKVYKDIEADYIKLAQGTKPEVGTAAGEIIEPILIQAKEASGAMMGVGAAFKKAIPTHSAKGGQEEPQGAEAPAMAESKKRRRNLKIKVLKGNKK